MLIFVSYVVVAVVGLVAGALVGKVNASFVKKAVEDVKTAVESVHTTVKSVDAKVVTVANAVVAKPSTPVVSTPVK